MLSSWIARHMFKAERERQVVTDELVMVASRRRYAYLLLSLGITCAALSFQILKLPEANQSNNHVGLIFALTFAGVLYFLGKVRSPDVVAWLTSTAFVLAGFFLGVGLYEVRFWNREPGTNSISAFVFIVSILALSTAMATSLFISRNRNLAFMAGVVVAITAMIFAVQSVNAVVHLKEIAWSAAYVSAGVLVVKLDDDRWRSTVATSAEGPVGVDRALGAKIAALLLIYAAVSILYLTAKVF